MPPKKTKAAEAKPATNGRGKQAVKKAAEATKKTQEKADKVTTTAKKTEVRPPVAKTAAAKPTAAKPAAAKTAAANSAAKRATSVKPAAAEKAGPKKRNTAAEPDAMDVDNAPAPRPASRQKSAPPVAKKGNTAAPPTKTRAASARPEKSAAASKKNDKPKSPEQESNKENDDPKEDAPKATSKAAAAAAAKKRKRASTPAAKEPNLAAEKMDVEGETHGDAQEAAEEADAPKPEVEKEEARPAKRARTAAAAPRGKIGVAINTAPSTLLDVFVFGEGSSGELGLGNLRFEGKKPIDVKRPRINHNLSADKVGVVQIACGGMHAVALTEDNRILTWGVNDQGALGRDTNWDGGLRDADADDSDSDDSDSGLNPKESIPTEIDTSEVLEGTVFVQVAACDSASFALTQDGRVYGWGTFRASDGILGFSPTVRIQKIPIMLPEPKKVLQLAAGSNHVMALDKAGKLLTWGCPEQNQLGRRCVQRDVTASALRPGGVGLKRGVKVAKIACGSYHSFALDSTGSVYAWGLNNFGELGVDDGAGDSDAAVLGATLVSSLADYKIADICGGEHHSVACTDDGGLLTWGRIDGHQVGLPAEAFNKENAIYDEAGRPRILKVPTVIKDIPKIVSVSAGTDNSFALTGDGKAYSWGFSTNYQTGQGISDDVEVPTLIDNTAVRGKKIVYAGAGGQYSVLASVHGEE